jgi:SecD/SecF fusion protein
MRPFLGRIIICLLPLLIATLVTVSATARYFNGEGGFKLGVDLVGGTILVYEVDKKETDRRTDKAARDEFMPDSEFIRRLAESVKRRIDPADLYNYTVRPLGTDRIEVILATGNAYQVELERRNWQELLDEVQRKYDFSEDDLKLLGTVEVGREGELVSRIAELLDRAPWQRSIEKIRGRYPKLTEAEAKKVPVGDVTRLAEAIKAVSEEKDERKIRQQIEAEFTPSSREEIRKYIDEMYSDKRRRVGGYANEVQRVRDLISQVGSLEFRILANNINDADAFEAMTKYFELAQTDPKLRDDLIMRAKAGQPPPFAMIPDPSNPKNYIVEFDTRTKRPVDNVKPGTFKVRPAPGDRESDWDLPYQAEYEWVEIGKTERHSLGLQNNPERRPKSAGGKQTTWDATEDARAKGIPVVLKDFGETMIYVRECINERYTEAERKAKKYDYFFLTRRSDTVKVDSETPITARSDIDASLRPVVAFQFTTTAGSSRFYDVTRRNRPVGPEGSKLLRHLAIVLDGEIQSAPTIRSPIDGRGQISGNFTKREVDNLVTILKAGALPATLNPRPVSQNTIGPTLGADTIFWGSVSVIVAFFAVIAFMIYYYRFAGLVASVALFANLLLTVGFMVSVNATFTLPGLAGLVLMLGMAVDANVLIYERLREERERGASLALALRNGYDRAYPTIIDTHLASIFTAIVLYTVGNDQLKGFGVSLTSGLVISLFTSLYMTRLMFDIALQRRTLTELKMLRLFKRPSINFMGIRKQVFALTLALTLFGVTAFVLRQEQAFNVDFVGGTVYSSRLAKGQEKSITELRDILRKENQQQRLQIKELTQTDEQGKAFRVVWEDGSTQLLELARPAAGETTEQHLADVRKRLSFLPDTAVEQLFLRSEEAPEGGKSRYFTIRTTEREVDIVEACVNRLFPVERIEYAQAPKFENDGQLWTIQFAEAGTANKEPTYVSRNTFENFLKRELARQLRGDKKYEQIVKAFDENREVFEVKGVGESKENLGQEFKQLQISFKLDVPIVEIEKALEAIKSAPLNRVRLENFDSSLAAESQSRAIWAIIASWIAVLLYLWFRFGNWTWGAAAVLCLIHDISFTLGVIALCHYLVNAIPAFSGFPFYLEDFKIDLTSIAALLTLVGYSVNDTIVVFDRIREVRGKNPRLTPEMINDSINQTLSRTILAATTTFLVVALLYFFGGDGLHLFAFVMVVGIIVGTYSSIYVASPLLLLLGEGQEDDTTAAAPAERPPREETETDQAGDD